MQPQRRNPTYIIRKLICRGNRGVIHRQQIGGRAVDQVIAGENVLAYITFDDFAGRDAVGQIDGIFSA